MKLSLLAALGAVAVSASASAQSLRFNLHAIISDDGETALVVVNGSNSLGPLQADVAAATLGQATTDTFATEFSYSVSSSTSNMLPGLIGECLGTGKYTLDGTQPLLVDWNWSSVSESGSWKVLDSLGNTVAALSFANGVYSSTGGSFGNLAAGNVSLNLAAGNYTFWSDFKNGGTATSAVNFTFGTIPAPGALALLGAAGLAGTRRRR